MRISDWSSDVCSSDLFSQAVENVQTANFDGPFSVIYAPRTSGTLDRLVDTTGQPLRPTPSFEALRKFTTTQVPIDQIGRATVGKACVRTCRSRWSPYH